MAHHTHFMQRWLTVEQNVANKYSDHCLIETIKGNSLCVLRSTIHPYCKNASARLLYRKSIRSLRHAVLVQLIRIARNDGLRGEIDMLSHQISAQMPFFALETGSDGFHGPARLLQSLWDTGDVVIHVGGDMEL